MEASIAKFFEMHGKLASGESFYTNLLMRLSKLHRTCEDISFSQQLQRQEYEQNCMREHERQMQVHSPLREMHASLLTSAVFDST